MTSMTTEICFSETAEDIATLMGLMVLVDNRLLTSEIKGFLIAMKEIRPHFECLNTLTQSDTLSWFNHNRDRLKATLARDDSRTYLVNLVKRLKPLPQKKRIYDAMQDIALSDFEFHESESRLLVLARTHWSDMNFAPKTADQSISSAA